MPTPTGQHQHTGLDSTLDILLVTCKECFKNYILNHLLDYRKLSYQIKGDNSSFDLNDILNEFLHYIILFTYTYIMMVWLCCVGSQRTIRKTQSTDKYVVFCHEVKNILSWAICKPLKPSLLKSKLRKVICIIMIFCNHLKSKNQNKIKKKKMLYLATSKTNLSRSRLYTNWNLK